MIGLMKKHPLSETNVVAGGAETTTMLSMKSCDASTSAESDDAEQLVNERIASFLNYTPSYSAEEFSEKVCSQLEEISQSYQNSAERYEQAILTTEKTMKICAYGIRAVD